VGLLSGQASAPGLVSSDAVQMRPELYRGVTIVRRFADKHDAEWAVRCRVYRNEDA
jgi:hypothetical protein